MKKDLELMTEKTVFCTGSEEGRMPTGDPVQNADCPGDCGSGQVEHQHENHCDHEHSNNHGHTNDLLHECCPEVPHTHAISVPHLSKNSHDFLTSISRPAEVVFFKKPLSAVCHIGIVSVWQRAPLILLSGINCSAYLDLNDIPRLDIALMQRFLSIPGTVSVN
jgi:hypothetical protein